MMRIKRLTHRNIRPYGMIIDASSLRDNGRSDSFGVLLKARSGGWRIAYLILREKYKRNLEMHPDSFETFEPVKGNAVIALAPEKSPYSVKLFYLDRPVVVHKGIWHNVLAIYGKCEMKIFENIEVRTKHHTLKEPISFLR